MTESMPSQDDLANLRGRWERERSFHDDHAAQLDPPTLPAAEPDHYDEAVLAAAGVVAGTRVQGYGRCRSPGARAPAAGGCGASSPTGKRPWWEANIDRNNLGSTAKVHAVDLGSRQGIASPGYHEHGGGNGALLDANSEEAVEMPVVRDR